jgi:hypothetical protein
VEFFCISWYAGRAYAAIAVLEVACGLLGSPVRRCLMMMMMMMVVVVVVVNID